MFESTDDAMPVQGIDLAQEPDFDLGSLRVRPATCEVERDSVSQTVQRRVMQVLVALAQARGSVVSQDDLVARCWRGLSVTDDAIFRCISKLRKLAADYPDAPFAIETIPGVGYRLTSSGVAAAPGPVAPAAPGNRRRSVRRLGVVALLAFVASIAAAIWIGRTNLGEPPPVRVTVAPFEALTSSENARALARSIPNQIVNQLGDSQVEAVLAGDKDGAGARSGLLVTGILHDDGRNTNVDVRIEDGPTHAALWSAQYKRASDQASDLPLEVAARVADEANMVTFARSAKPSLTDNAALSALLEVTDMIRDPSDGAWAQMIERAEALVARHPKFAFGHDVLAVAYAEAANSVGIPDRANAMRDAAAREAKLTLKLDPEDAGAYVVLSDLQPTYDHRAREAILLRGLKLAKHPKEPLGGLYSAEGRLLDDVGRLRESVSLKLVAHATDEWGAPKTAQLARAYANLGNLPAARTWLQKGMQLWPNHSGVRRVRKYVAGFYEPPAAAMAVFGSADATMSADDAVWRSFVEAKAAHSARVSAAAIERIRAAADRGDIPREIQIMMLADLGATKQAMEAANWVVGRQQVQTWFLFTPVTGNMRQDPGFVRLADRLGLIKYWRETGKLPDFCSDPARRSECSAELLAAIRSRGSS